ncbi:MAG: phosphoglucosamine mutase [Cytophagaceae bacterium]|nr:phosphoglucosamine mutase [Cytophagaceae bacterium]
MTLIKSISGIRGTIGGKTGTSLTPIDVARFASAYGAWIKKLVPSNKVVIGRDARLSGEMISRIVISSLQGLGIEVLDLGLSTTPTVEMAVIMEKAAGGIIITASHNPIEWNALKLLDGNGEFISDEVGKKILELAESEDISFATVHELGGYTHDDSYIDKHIQKILELPLVDAEAIRKRNFSIAIDAVNSTGGIAVPKLLKALGVEKITPYFCEPNGRFPHNPEPLAENLTFISGEIKKGGIDLGIVVDPDVDRLCFINEDGSMFGEEYTLVAVADYVLQHTPGNTVSNLSSTRALKDITERAKGAYFASAVGEVNVVAKMKQCQAVIGGEGNGGVIYPELHYGRDALVGIALFLSHLAKKGGSISQLRASYPHYQISKNKMELTDGINVDALVDQMKVRYKDQPINDVDGVRIDFDREWVHLRKSNTEPIIRIYAESENLHSADTLAKKMISELKEILEKDEYLL